MSRTEKRKVKRVRGGRKAQIGRTRRKIDTRGNGLFDFDLIDRMLGIR